MLPNISQDQNGYLLIIENKLIFSQILSFLDSQAITSLVLVNSKTRFTIGSVIHSVIYQQQLYHQQQADGNEILKEVFEPFENAVKSIVKDFDEKSYQRIVQSISASNIAFFESFFNSVLNTQPIALKAEKLSKQKQGLLQIGQNIKKSLNQILEEKRVPSTGIQQGDIDAFQNYSNIHFQQQTITLKKRMISFMENLIRLKSLQRCNADYQSYCKGVNYLSSKIKIRVPKRNVYSNKIYCFKFGNSLLSYLNHNIASKVLQYLPVLEILKVRLVNKWFNFQIPVLMPIIINSIVAQNQEIQHQLESIDSDILHFINLNIQNKTCKQHICEAMSIKTYPKQTVDLMELFFNLTELKIDPYYQSRSINEKIRYFFGIYYNRQDNRFFDVDYYFQIDASKYLQVEQYFDTHSYSNVKSTSYCLERAYLNLQINYLLSKVGIGKCSYHEILKKNQFLQYDRSKPYKIIHQNLLSVTKLEQ